MTVDYLLKYFEKDVSLHIPLDKLKEYEWPLTTFGRLNFAVEKNGAW